MNCALRYIGGILELKKLDFRGQGRFDVKKANYGGQITKIGFLRPIFASRTYLCSIFIDFVMGMCSKVYCRDFRARKFDFRGLKAN